jgi:starch synthase
VSFLKAGLTSSDAITTVSPSYANEIMTAEFGMGMEGLLRSRRSAVSGIVNGLDLDIWSPATDKDLKATYTTASLPRRATNKRAIEEAFGLESHDGPLFIVVSRLTWQKGMDVVVETLDHLVQSGARLALLGTGEAAIESQLRAAASRYPGKVGVKIGYDEALSHLMQGGGDAILIPSRFEPCGLTQLYGLAYGCVPIVARTGGLADTVIDANLAAIRQGVATGIQFSPLSPDALREAITRAVSLYTEGKPWKAMQRRGMAADFSWARSGALYASLYQSLLKTS